MAILYLALNPNSVTIPQGQGDNKELQYISCLMRWEDLTFNKPLLD